MLDWVAYSNSLPGETGWTPELAASMNRPNVKNAVKSLMQVLLREVVADSRSWPYRKPVDAAEVADYYDVIKNPMGTHFRFVFF